MSRPGLLLLGLLAVLASSGCGSRAMDDTARARWSARKPVVADGKITGWTEAPEFLAWRPAAPDAPAGDVLTVSLTGPFSTDAWSQHAGALFSLPRTFLVGQPFTLRFQARSLSGPAFLTVLRSWGGAKPWEAIPITTQWATYRVTLLPEHPTDLVTFSLVARAGGLQPYAAGTFELAEVGLESTPAR